MIKHRWEGDNGKIKMKWAHPNVKKGKTKI